jgi:hypothetical protein
MKGKAKYIIGGIVALVLIAAVAGSSGTDTNTAETNSSNQLTEQSQESSETVAKIGTPVRDGKFEFTIKSMDCSRTSVGSEFLTEEAQGKFCILDMNVKNIGDEAQTFFSSEQKVFNAEGQQFSNDTEAELSIDGNTDAWLEEINPGNFVNGKVVFDVPADTTLVKAELHDSAFSNGVEVTLSQL